MAARSARWADALFPFVAVRQWVLTMPWKRPWELARHPELLRGVLGVLQRELAAYYRDRCGLPAGHTGAVTVMQRFGSALNLNVHLHCLLPDGVFFRDSGTGKVFFKRARAPTTAQVEALVVRVAEQCEAWLSRHGLAGEVAEESTDEDVLALLQGVSVQGRVATTGRRVQWLGGRPFALPPLGALGSDLVQTDVGVYVVDLDGDMRAATRFAFTMASRLRTSSWSVTPSHATFHSTTPEA